jgi:hypothetical protein
MSDAVTASEGNKLGDTSKRTAVNAASVASAAKVIASCTQKQKQMLKSAKKVNEAVSACAAAARGLATTVTNETLKKGKKLENSLVLMLS